MTDEELLPARDDEGGREEAPPDPGGSGYHREPLFWGPLALSDEFGLDGQPSQAMSSPSGNGNDISGRRAAAIGLSLIALALLVVAAVSVGVRQPDSRAGATPNPNLATFLRAGLPSDVAAIAISVDEGVVNITSQLGSPQAQAIGTGVVISASGEVLTNHHVIDGAKSIRVTDIGNGRTYSATVVGSDVTHDIAVLQLKGASGLKTIPLGDSSKVAVGDAIIALGNALGTGGTSSVATGKVTALDQSITATDESGANAEQLDGLIEVDAPLQPGDSGGPLVDGEGKLVGINTAASGRFRFRRARRTATTAYAVPINQAMAIATRIESGQAP
jgi:S1-C subfamily serine protease